MLCKSLQILTPLVLVEYTRMATQKTLSSFFKPIAKLPTKRNSDNQGDESDSPQFKRLHSNSENVVEDKPDPSTKGPAEKSCLSPEQKERSERNRAQAKAKLLSKKFTALSTNIGSSWLNALEKEFSKEYFQKLSNFLESERSKYTIYPPVDDVYSWTNMCNITEVKVVILGQDPYHGPKQAHGLAFSVQKGVAAPPSLVNMYKELANDIPGFEIPSHGCLQGWAEQGVLLLNAVLTVRSANANSHKDQGWEQLTDAVIRYLNDNLTGVAFLLWGSYAQKKGSFINKKRHLVLHSPHPSPLSAHRGFLGCRHFSKANEYLTSLGKTPIDWKMLP